MEEKWFLNVMMLSQPHLANWWVLIHHLCKKFDEFNGKKTSETTFQFLFFSFFTDKPTGTSITSSPTNNTVLRNSSLVFSCRTDANPAAHIYNFYFNGTFIGVNNLGRYPVTVQADGEYTCVPLNTVGTGDNATFAVIAVGK